MNRMIILEASLQFDVEEYCTMHRMHRDTSS
jgi:hypothetical protein